MSFCLFKLKKNKRHDDNIFVNFLIEIQFCSANKFSKVVSPVYKAMVGVLLRNSFSQQLRLTRHLKSEHFMIDRWPTRNREKFAYRDSHKFLNIAYASRPNFDKTSPSQQRHASICIYFCLFRLEKNNRYDENSFSQLLNLA